MGRYKKIWTWNELYLAIIDSSEMVMSYSVKCSWTFLMKNSGNLWKTRILQTVTRYEQLAMNFWVSERSQKFITSCLKQVMVCKMTCFVVNIVFQRLHASMCWSITSIHIWNRHTIYFYTLYKLRQIGFFQCGLSQFLPKAHLYRVSHLYLFFFSMILCGHKQNSYLELALEFVETW